GRHVVLTIRVAARNAETRVHAHTAIRPVAAAAALRSDTGAGRASLRRSVALGDRGARALDVGQVACLALAGAVAVATHPVHAMGGAALGVDGARRAVRGERLAHAAAAEVSLRAIGVRAAAGALDGAADPRGAILRALRRTRTLSVAE